MHCFILAIKNFQRFALDVNPVLILDCTLKASFAHHLPLSKVGNLRRPGVGMCAKSLKGFKSTYSYPLSEWLATIFWGMQGLD